MVSGGPCEKQNMPCRESLDMLGMGSLFSWYWESMEGGVGEREKERKIEGQRETGKRREKKGGGRETENCLFRRLPGREKGRQTEKQRERKESNLLRWQEGRDWE